MLVNITEQSSASSVDILILGAGWTSTYLIPLLQSTNTSYAATTTTGRDGTIPFKFDPSSSDSTPFTHLPLARTVLITFPLKGPNQSKLLTNLYSTTHHDATPNFIQLGVTSIWTAQTWHDESSPYNTSDPRAIAEDELLTDSSAPAAVLSLAALYGHDRQPRGWFGRVIPSKDVLRGKGALHVIHGQDVARAVVALHESFTPGKRWILCDTRVYDWWDLVQDWARAGLNDDIENGSRVRVLSKDEGDAKAKCEEMLGWVGELMVEEGVKALPRDASAVGRALDGRAFWHKMGIWPSQGRLR